MRADKRLALLASLAAGAFALAACGGDDPDNTDGGPGTVTCNPIEEECECIESTDCIDDELFFCNQTTFTCQPSCRSKADCSAEARGEYALSFCEGNLGCVCDEGTCMASLCSADADCGQGNACRNGTCVAVPAASAATSCRITPDYAFIKEGEKAKFWVSFWAGNEPLVLSQGIEWSAATDRVAAPTANGASAEFTGLTAGDANDAVKVTAGGAECFAQVRTLTASVTATDVRVSVINELTGRPVQGATVLLSNPTNGNEITSGTTAANGSVSLDFSGAANVTVSAFHNDYTYVTLANVPTGGSRDFVIATRRNQVDQYGGYKGTFQNRPQTPNVHAAIAGMSIPGAVTDLSVTQLLGHSVPTDVVIGSAINQEDVPLPAGVYLMFSDSAPIKDQVSAQGVAGVCYDANGQPREADILAGTCGTRTAWGLAGDVPIGELPIDAVAGGLDNLDFGKILARVVPIFRRFSSSVVRDVQFDLQDVTNPNDPDFSDVSHFTEANHQFGQMPLGFSFAVKIPDLPQFRNSYADGVLVLGGADVKGRGVVPLGLGAGVNTTEPKDARVDAASPLPAGHVLMRMAPTHHGLEGSQYGITALAVSLQSLNDASAGLAVSALYHRLAENRLVFDPTGETPVDLGTPFMAYPENARYNFTDSANQGLAARTFRFTTGGGVSGADVIRVQFSDIADRRWQVLSTAADAAAGIRIPEPPGGYEDRTFEQGNASGERSPLMVQALQLRDGTTEVSLQTLAQANGTNMDRIGDFLTAFSAIDYGRPEIDWVEPAEGATIAPGSTLRIDVSNFRVGTGAEADGHVRIMFAGGAGCTEQRIEQDASGGAGELSLTLPTACTGAGISMTAVLYDNANQPIAPGVSAQRTVTIQ